MELLDKDVLRILIVVPLLVWSVALAVQVGRRSGKHWLWHLLGFKKTLQFTKPFEVIATLVLLVATLFALSSTVDYNKMIEDAKKPMEQQSSQTAGK